ncbi:hypothetical protein LPJ72_005384 [Coemansia sp. Benny D160-2]|nr:hypothetical protein LPJ72_005384 [Coemansia sp. Benny D160-2]
MPRLRWHDTHNKLIRRGDGRRRKPDGCFVVGSTSNVLWQDISVAVEIKGDTMDAEHHLIRGQLLQDFIDMAETVPRRFMIGLTLSRGGAIYLYVCVPGRIYIAPLYNLPSPCVSSTDSTDSKRLVAFFLFLHQQLGKDSGYLTGHNAGVSCDFRLDTIVATSQGSDNILSLSTVVRLGSADGVTGGVFGRHRHLKGQRTWSYPAKCYDGKIHNTFFKFQWGYDGDFEIDVHRFVLAKGVPHVPKLLYTANVEGKGVDPKGQQFKGEVLVMENVGENTIWSAFDRKGLDMSDARIVDIFAGYVHTLIAAAVVDRQKKSVLHRDVSMGNLMVGDNGSPYVIDWGCGRVCTDGEEPRSSGKQMIGTAIYMGIRILTNCATRSVVDDLESLFLVFCHCLWDRYGTTNNDHAHLWSESDLSRVKDSRMGWLATTDNLINRMGFSPNGPPRALRTLAIGMHSLLFPSEYPIYSFDSAGNDPRVSNFDAKDWLQVFETAREHLGADASLRMPCLAKLRIYVRKSSGRRISSIIQPTIQPSKDSLAEDNPHASLGGGPVVLLDESDTGSHPESPTPSGSKKRSLGSLSDPSSPKRKR